MISAASKGKIGYSKCANPKYNSKQIDRLGLGVMMGCHLIFFILTLTVPYFEVGYKMAFRKIKKEARTEEFESR
jgi:hypothetical protein